MVPPVSQGVAPEMSVGGIERRRELRPMVMELVGILSEMEGTAGDMAHALVFVLVMHQVRNDWTTEEVLQLWERYVREIGGEDEFSMVPHVGEA